MKLSKFLISLCTLGIFFMMSGCATVQNYFPIKRKTHNVQQFSPQPRHPAQQSHRPIHQTANGHKLRHAPHHTSNGQKSRHTTSHPAKRIAPTSIVHNPARRPARKQPSVMAVPPSPRRPLPVEVKF